MRKEQESLQLSVKWQTFSKPRVWQSCTFRYSGKHQGLEQGSFYDENGLQQAAAELVYSERLLSGFGTLQQLKNQSVSVTNSQDTLLWLVCREGKLTIDAGNEPMTLTGGMQQLLYLPGGQAALLTLEAEQASFYLLLVGSSFFKYFLAEESRLQEKMAGYDTLSWLLEEPRILHPNQAALISELQYCYRIGPYKRIFTASKAIEMFLLLQELPAETGEHKQHPISPELRQRMEILRASLDRELKQPPTLAALARLVGTNVFTFKQTFKTLFGTTVFAYHQSRKMEAARALLRQKEMRIGEIADQLGYKNQQHFSVAFKKYFGIRPSDVK